MAGDPYDLERFLAAQEDVWPDVVAELEAGAKRSHWMWFVFPQIAGLGGSPTAVRYAIGSRRRKPISSIRCSALGCARRRHCFLVTGIAMRRRCWEPSMQ